MAHKFEVKNIYEYYAQWIREGKLKVNSDWNKDLKIKFTVQDPCQIVRKSYGHLWTIICLALGILGENEREYLKPDLKNVAVYGA